MSAIGDRAGLQHLGNNTKTPAVPSLDGREDGRREGKLGLRKRRHHAPRHALRDAEVHGARPTTAQLRSPGIRGCQTLQLRHADPRIEIPQDSALVGELDAWEATLPGEDVVGVEPLGRGDVARLRLGGGSTVIVKKHGRDPRNSADERASLLFLSDHPRTPAVLAVNDHSLVLEDVPGPSIAELLLGNDRDAAALGLISLGRTLGELHAWSRPHLNDYERRREAAGPPRARELRHRPTARATLRARLEECGLPAPAGLDADHDTVDALISDPGPFRALVHGDPCPDNAIMSPSGSVTLIDFEWSMVGHALLDGVYIEVPFPTCWCYGTVPEDIVTSVADAYRQAVAIDVDQRRWDAAVTAASASWWLAGIDEFLSAGFAVDSAWGTASLRQRILHRGARFAALTERTGSLPALGAAAKTFIAHLASAWDAAPPAPYPAFR